jgi:hypothetical protein
VSQLQRELSSAVSLMHDEQSSAAQATTKLEAKVTATVSYRHINRYNLDIFTHFQLHILQLHF